MLIGTYLHRGSYVTVAVEFDAAERPSVVLERQDRPGEVVERSLAQLGSFHAALYQAESWLLLRGGLPGAEAENLASSPVSQAVVRAMFDPASRGRFLHLGARRRPPA